MDILADLPTPIHLHGLPLQFGEFELNGRTRIVGRYLKLQFEGVSHQVVDEGAGALPFGAFLVGYQLKPVIILLFVIVDVADQSLVLLLHAFDPLLSVFGACLHRKHGDLLEYFLNLALHRNVYTRE